MYLEILLLPTVPISFYYLWWASIDEDKLSAFSSDERCAEHSDVAHAAQVSDSPLVLVDDSATGLGRTLT